MTRFERPRGTPELSPDAERASHREQVTRDVIARQGALWQRTPMAQRDAHVDHLYGHGMLNRLTGFQAQAIPVADRARETLLPALVARSPGATATLERICTALKAAPPVYGETPNRTNHPYLRYRTADKLSVYEIDYKATQKDIAALEELKKGFPDASHAAERAALDTLIVQLSTLAPQDPGIAVRMQADRMAGKSMMDVAGKQMGRIGLIGILATGTAVFGTIGAVNFVRKGEFSAAPFLWGFATWFLADGQLRKSFFGERYEKEFDEIKAVTSNVAFRKLAAEYGIGGTTWKNIIRETYAAKHNKALRAVLTQKNPSDEEIRLAVSTIAGTGTRAGEMMRTIDPATGKTHFQILHGALTGATREESQTFIQDFVERDCARQATLPSS